MRKKEERDQILYGMFNRLLKARRQQYKGEQNAAARALNDTYADVGILFNINPITIRHILSRMDHGAPAVRNQSENAALNAACCYMQILKDCVFAAADRGDQPLTEWR